MSWKYGGEDQMTIGEVWAYLSKIPVDHLTRWSLLYAHSYRGFYEDVAMSVRDSGRQTKIAELMEEVNKCRGTFTGYKGGEYTMDEDTPVWVADPGSIGIPLTRGFLDLIVDYRPEDKTFDPETPQAVQVRDDRNSGRKGRRDFDGV
jgi:hypothetical protein